LGILLPFNIDRPGILPGIFILRLAEKRVEAATACPYAGRLSARNLRANRKLRKGSIFGGLKAEFAIWVLPNLDFVI
jgi:hypothetical protein